MQASFGSTQNRDFCCGVYTQASVLHNLGCSPEQSLCLEPFFIKKTRKEHGNS